MLTLNRLYILDACIAGILYIEIRNNIVYLKKQEALLTVGTKQI